MNADLYSTSGKKARSQMEAMGPNWQVDELSRVVILFRSESNREINSKCHMVSEGLGVRLHTGEILGHDDVKLRKLT